MLMGYNPKTECTIKVAMINNWAGDTDKGTTDVWSNIVSYGPKFFLVGDRINPL